MGACVRLILAEDDAPYVAAAVVWICKAYAGVEVRTASQFITLQDERISGEELRRVWAAGLLNEKAFAQGQARRGRGLAGLSA